MHRLLVATESLAAECPELSREAERHLKVLRLDRGEAVELFDGRGRSRTFVWNGGLRPDGDVRFQAQSPVSRTLFACVTKGSRWDWTIEKATELGVTRIVPVISDRTVVRISSADRAAKRERWMRVAEDAARQSNAKWLPEILEPLDFKSSLDLVRSVACFVGALIEPPPEPLAQAVARARADGASDFAVYVGPEGDFTPEELAALVEIAVPTTFGANVLRAETAAIYAVSVLASVLV